MAFAGFASSPGSPPSATTGIRSRAGRGPCGVSAPRRYAVDDIIAAASGAASGLTNSPATPGDSPSGAESDQSIWPSLAAAPIFRASAYLAMEALAGRVLRYLRTTSAEAAAV